MHRAAIAGCQLSSFGSLRRTGKRHTKCTSCEVELEQPTDQTPEQMALRGVLGREPSEVHTCCAR